MNRFERRAGAVTGTCVTDAALLRHILDNLLSNAVRYSGPGKLVTVELVVDSTGTRLTVEDQGIGIPAEDLPRLFQPFERGSNVGTIKGTGSFLMRAKRVGRDTLLSQIVAMVNQAQRSRAPIQGLADRVSWVSTGGGASLELLEAGEPARATPQIDELERSHADDLHRLEAERLRAWQRLDQGELGEARELLVRAFLDEAMQGYGDENLRAALWTEIDRTLKAMGEAA